MAENSNSDDESADARMDEAENRYKDAVKQFTSTLEHATSLSQSIGGLNTNVRLQFASFLFCRATTISTSLLSLCPGSKVNLHGINWDFGSIASITRNLHECVLNLFYISVEEVDAVERDCRLNLMNLHDCSERKRMFEEFGTLLPDEAAIYDTQIDECKNILSDNAFFKTFTPKQQAALLKGKEDRYLTRTEILKRLGHSDNRPAGIYRFLSSQTHSFPMSFYRMGIHNRGRSEKNEVEAHHIATALEFADSNLEEASKWIKNLFDAECDLSVVEPYDLFVLNSLVWQEITGSASDSALKSPIQYD